MMSTDFSPIVSPLGGVGRARHMAKGGHAKAPPGKKPHHLTIVIAQPHPLMGALAAALLLRQHLAARAGRGPLSAAMRQGGQR